MGPVKNQGQADIGDHMCDLPLDPVGELPSSPQTGKGVRWGRLQEDVIVGCCFTDMFLEVG